MNLYRCALSSLASFILLLSLLPDHALAQQRTSALRGQVTDELGGIIVGATVTATDPNSVEKTAITNDEGIYTFNALTPGKYTIRASATGFAVYENIGVNILPARREALDIKLSVALEKQEVTVAAETPLSVEAENNADALRLRGKDLDVLPDDPDGLASAVQAMAGPSAGPSGGQINIDGFTGGRMPPKESIREVRVNQNPFNAENDRPGFGRIDIFTKPGTDGFHGSAFFNFADESLNSRNPFAPSRAPFQVRLYGGSLSGPIIPKKSSFFFDFQRRETDDNEIINATILDPTLSITRFNQVVLQPQRFLTFSPRFDYQLNQNNTLVARYSFSRTRAENAGVSTFSLLERAYNRANSEHTVQITETAVISPNMLTETRFQFIRNRVEQLGDNAVPTISVLEAFIGGGSQVGLAFANENRWELQNLSTLTVGRHVLRFGGRLRGVRIIDVSPQNFGGTFTFAGGIAPEFNANNEMVRDSSGNPVLVPITSIERYRRTLLLQGRSPEEIRALGGGPTQFTIAGGNPEASVTQVDLGAFFQDEWRLRPNFTLTLGLRYERQTNISSNYNFAPRIFFAWAPGGKSVGGGPGSNQPKMVIRGGIGFFYDRFNERGTLFERRFNGINQQDYRIFDPAVLNLAQFTLSGVSNVPTLDTLAAFASPQVIRRVADDFQTPYSTMTAINVERQLPHKFTLFALIFNYRTRHVLRVRNINAPLPGTYDPRIRDSGVRPYGNVGDIYYYESSGVFNDYRGFIGLRNQLSKGFSVFANYGTGRAKSDSDCIFGFLGSCFPANTYDLSSEYSRVAFFPRHFFFFGGTVTIPKIKMSLNPFIIATTGRRFNITTGRDTNGDGLFTERPAFATDRTNPTDLRRTPYGDFDLNPAPGQQIIPRNYGTGPGFFSINLGLSRTFSFGEAQASAANIAPASPQSSGGSTSSGANTNRATTSSSKTSSGSGSKESASSNPPKTGGSPAPEKRYKLTLSINIQNLLNRTNLGLPIGNLSSPFFGQSTTTANNFGFGPGGGSSAAGNRRMFAQVRINF